MTSDIIPGDSLMFGALVGNLPNPLTFMLNSLHSVSTIIIMYYVVATFIIEWNSGLCQD